MLFLKMMMKYVKRVLKSTKIHKYKTIHKPDPCVREKDVLFILVNGKVSHVQEIIVPSVAILRIVKSLVIKRKRLSG